ncbi:ubiquinol-cytochrome c reductase iron-sulfur subunit [Planctomycetota bacterium]
MEQKHTSRRDFIESGVIAIVASACGGCALFGSRKPDAVVQADEGVLRLDKPDSEFLLASVTSRLIQPKGTKEKILVVHRGGGKLSAVSAICTHKGCNVNYDMKLGRIVCPCHGSQYSLEGQIIKGPSELPLKQYNVETDDGQIVISL